MPPAVGIGALCYRGLGLVGSLITWHTRGAIVDDPGMLGCSECGRAVGCSDHPAPYDAASARHGGWFARRMSRWPSPVVLGVAAEARTHGCAHLLGVVRKCPKADDQRHPREICRSQRLSSRPLLLARRPTAQEVGLKTPPSSDYLRNISTSHERNSARLAFRVHARGEVPTRVNVLLGLSDLDATRPCDFLASYPMDDATRRERQSENAIRCLMGEYPSVLAS